MVDSVTKDEHVVWLEARLVDALAQADYYRYRDSRDVDWEETLDSTKEFKRRRARALLLLEYNLDLF